MTSVFPSKFNPVFGFHEEQVITSKPNPVVMHITVILFSRVQYK